MLFNFPMIRLILRRVYITLNETMAVKIPAMSRKSREAVGQEKEESE